MKFYLSGKIKIWNLHDYIYLQAASDWFYSYPIGFKKLLVYIKEKYNNPLIYVTENGKLQQSSINIAKYIYEQTWMYMYKKIMDLPSSMYVLVHVQEIFPQIINLICRYRREKWSSTAIGGST